MGFCGVGNMGAQMALQLAKSGHDVAAYDVDLAKVESLSQMAMQDLDCPGSIRAAKSLKDICKPHPTAVITMLPNVAHVRSVYSKDNGLLSGCVSPSTLMIDCSTIDPLTASSISAEAAQIGLALIDAPVSGGVPAAASGSLTFIVGGAAEHIIRARPLLELMGKNVVHCGPSGSGCIAKLCNNLSLAIAMIATSEAMNLGQQLGMDPKVLAHVLNTSTARCWSSDSYNPCPGVMENVPSARGYTGGFSAQLMLKDLGLALQAAKEQNVSLPTGALAHQLYTLMCLQEGGEGARKDFSAIFQLITKGQVESTSAARNEKQGAGAANTTTNY